MDIEVIKNIIELISSFIFWGGVVVGAFAFKYKYDANIRDLYVENCKKIQEVIEYVDSNGQINDIMFNKLKNAYNEARIYLPTDVVHHITKIFNWIYSIKHDKELTPVNIVKMHKLYDNAIIIYRLHIVQSPNEIVKYWFKKLTNAG